MYGFIMNKHNTAVVANKIFEMRLYRYFVGESEFAQDMRREALKDKPEFIKNGVLDVPYTRGSYKDNEDNETKQ